LTKSLNVQDKAAKYEELLQDFKAISGNETDLVANLANLSALIKEAFHFHWVGSYLVKGEELVLGPFQGPVACVRIKKGSGVCGSSWVQNQTIVVEDVDKFPGHIACSPFSKSEIVLPIHDSSGAVIGVIDIDSDKLCDFDEMDSTFLKQIVEVLEQRCAIAAGL
jgi:L-methionine (R)-S-oxide reductase